MITVLRYLQQQRTCNYCELNAVMITSEPETQSWRRWKKTPGVREADDVTSMEKRGEGDSLVFFFSAEVVEEECLLRPLNCQGINKSLPKRNLGRRSIDFHAFPLVRNNAKTDTGKAEKVAEYKRKMEIKRGNKAFVGLLNLQLRSTFDTSEDFHLRTLVTARWTTIFCNGSDVTGDRTNISESV